MTDEEHAVISAAVRVAIEIKAAVERSTLVGSYEPGMPMASLAMRLQPYVELMAALRALGAAQPGLALTWTTRPSASIPASGE